MGAGDENKAMQENAASSGARLAGRARRSRDRRAGSRNRCAGRIDA
jgi:hypothetical protein